MIAISRNSLITFFVVVFILTTGRMVFATTIADSVTEFSGAQGQNNWYYGYYDGDSGSNSYSTADFEQLTNFNSTGGYWSYSNPYGANSTWTLLWATGGHPNGSNTNGIVHWATRRWVSEVAGIINISGTLAKADPNGGNGITGHIFIDGLQVYAQHINFNDSTGVNYAINANVLVGSLIDFAINPEFNDWNDSTKFTATIETAPVPEPATMLLMGTGIAGLAGSRLRRKKK